MAEQDTIQNRVLDAAKSLFLHYGYDKTTINDIAREAGVAKSTIYTRWNKKDALFDTLIWRESKQYTVTWIARIEADPDGGTYGAWMRHALAGFFENDFLRALYKNERGLIGGMLKRRGIESLFLQRIQLFKGFFEAMQQAGVVRQNIDAQTLTYLLNALQYGLIHFVDIIPDSHTPQMDETLGMMVDMIEGYVTPEEGVDSDAGKQVLRNFMQRVQTILNDYEGQ